MATQQQFSLFMRAILTSRRTLKLYPEGTQQAGIWLPRFRRALNDAFAQGLVFPIYVGRDRFTWSGGELVTSEPAMETLRFDLQSRGIVWFAMEPEVEDWEIRAFLELLLSPPEALGSVVGAPAYLRDRNVIRVVVGVPSLSGVPDYEGSGERASGGGDVVGFASSPGTGGAALPPVDSLQGFAEAVLASIDEYLKELVYDRERLKEWFNAIFATGEVDALYSGVRMLAAMAEEHVDREIRLRTILEALFQLPETTYGALIANRMIPLASYDLEAFNLLTQLTEEELRLIHRNVPEQQLMTLSTDLLEFPWETGKRQRLVEAVTWTLRQSTGLEGPTAVPLPPDDPVLAELRREIVDASKPEKLLERGVDILTSLLFDDPSREPSAQVVGALSSAIYEALELKMPALGLQILRETLARATSENARPELKELSTELKLKAAGLAHITLLAEPLRDGSKPEHTEIVAEYIRLVGEAGVQAFTELLADEQDRRVRVRMCEALVRLGAVAVPTLVTLARDPRWFMARNAIYTLGKIGLASAIPAVTAALENPHPKVKIEAVRAARLLNLPGITNLLLRLIKDPDASVRRAAIGSLRGPGTAAAIPALQTIVLAPIREDTDWDVKTEAMNALVSIGTPAARTVLQEVARRRAWLWARNERRLKGMAEQALARLQPGTSSLGESA
jgi:hypothetical protein